MKSVQGRKARAQVTALPQGECWPLPKPTHALKIQPPRNEALLEENASAITMYLYQRMRIGDCVLAYGMAVVSLSPPLAAVNTPLPTELKAVIMMQLRSKTVDKMEFEERNCSMGEVEVSYVNQI